MKLPLREAGIGGWVKDADGRTIFKIENDDQSDMNRAELLRLVHMVNFFPLLLEACEAARCECTIKERLSGHRIGCWYPQMEDAINRAQGSVG